MATRTRNYTSGTYASHWVAHLDYWVNWQDSNSNVSNIGMNLLTYSDNSAYSQWGTFTGRIYLNGSQVAALSSEKTISNSGQSLTSWSGSVGHDANGNLYVTIGDEISAPVNSAARSDLGWTLPRLARAPSIADTSSDTVTPNSARLGVEINDFGLGTSAAMRMYYRVQGSGSGWSQTADQNDAAGYNYWTVASLTPGTTYEYFARVWNNNGDTRDSGAKTFKTQSPSGLLPVIMALAS